MRIIAECIIKPIWILPPTDVEEYIRRERLRMEYNAYANRCGVALEEFINSKIDREEE